MYWHVPEDAMPWVGLYCAVASSICTLAMTADVANGFWQWKLRFPNKIFTLNATTITLNAIAMKLPVDLTNVPLVVLPILLPFPIALTVLTSRRILEQRYKESQQLVSSYQVKRYSSKDLKSYLKKFWIVSETCDPQFAIAFSPVSCAFGVICIYLSIRAIILVISINHFLYDAQIYKWSAKIILFVQTIGVIVEMRCHHHAIEKRGDNIRSAAQLLGKSKKILKILKARQPFNIDQDSMAYIDKWHAILKSQTPIGSLTTTNDASSTRIEGGSSNSNELVIVTVL
ncbi:hypothetical protein R6Q59_027528 [Mikania micrantha]